MAGNKLPKVIEVCLVERFRSDKALVSLFILTKLLINSLDVQRYINYVTWIVSSLSLLILFALQEFDPVRCYVLNFGNHYILSKF